MDPKDFKNIEEIVHAYGKVVEITGKETKTKYLAYVYPESLLPYPKKAIKEALDKVIGYIDDKNMIEALQTTSVLLDRFINDEEANRRNKEMLLKSQDMKATQEIFVGLIIDREQDLYTSYIVNPTEKSYKRVQGYTGAFCGDDDGLIETSRAVRELGELKPYSSIYLEEGDMGTFDFVVWFLLDFYPDNQIESLQKMSFHFPKYALGYEKSMEVLPILNRSGQKIKLEQRTSLSGKVVLSIEEEVHNKSKQ